MVAAALVLPIALVVVVAAGQLLVAMGDPDGSRVLSRVALSLGLVWAIDLVCLLTVLGMRALTSGDEPPAERLD